MSEVNHNLKPRAQDAAWNVLVRLSEALPQAMIFVGPSGVGKKRAARALFQLIHCTGSGTGADESASLFGGPAEAETTEKRSEPCGHCTACRKVAEARHVDLIEITPKGDNIAVDDLRELKKSLSYPPAEGRKRFIIIDEAHKLNAASANAILKDLEEPPAHTRWVLITHERGLLLPTIVSRCQFVHFSPLDDGTLTELLSEQGFQIPDGLRPLTLRLLAGGMDRAAQLTSEAAISFMEGVQRILVNPSSRWEDVALLADQLAGAESGDWKLEILLDILVLGGHRSALASRDLAEARRAVGKALEAVYLRRRLDRHANKKLVALAAAELAAR